MRRVLGLALALALVGCGVDEGVSPGAEDTGASEPTEDTSPGSEDATGEDEDGATADDVVEADVEVEEPGPPQAHAVPIGAEDDTFFVGPYVMHTTRTSVSVSWETEEEGDTRLEYGPDADYGEVVEGEAGTLHQVELTGLEPSTVYHYRACTGDSCTGDLTLSTAPVEDQAFRFVVYGDSRSDPTQHRHVVEDIIASEPSVVFHTGDIVAQGRRDEYRTMHFDPSRRLGHHVPIYVAIGNHEWKELNKEVAHFRDYLVYPKDGPEGVEVPRPGLNYGVTYGDAFYLIMDNTMDGGNLFVPLGDVEPPLYKWLKAQVASEAAQNARWRFAFFHYPPASPCQEDWPMVRATREEVLPMLREHGFQAMFAGHVHNYERHDYDGFPVIITGGGGAGLEHEDNCTGESDTLVKMRMVHHHVAVDLTKEAALVQAIDVSGEVIDTLSLEP